VYDDDRHANNIVIEELPADTVAIHTYKMMLFCGSSITITVKSPYWTWLIDWANAKPRNSFLTDHVLKKHFYNYKKLPSVYEDENTEKTTRQTRSASKSSGSSSSSSSTSWLYSSVILKGQIAPLLTAMSRANYSDEEELRVKEIFKGLLSRNNAPAPGISQLSLWMKYLFVSPELTIDFNGGNGDDVDDYDDDDDNGNDKDSTKDKDAAGGIKNAKAFFSSGYCLKALKWMRHKQQIIPIPHIINDNVSDYSNNTTTTTTTTTATNSSSSSSSSTDNNNNNNTKIKAARKRGLSRKRKRGVNNDDDDNSKVEEEPLAKRPRGRPIKWTCEAARKAAYRGALHQKKFGTGPISKKNPMTEEEKQKLEEHRRICSELRKTGNLMQNITRTGTVVSGNQQTEINGPKTIFDNYVFDNNDNLITIQITKEKGLGVVAKSDIAEGTKITQYSGVCNEASVYDNDIDSYFKTHWKSVASMHSYIEGYQRPLLFTGVASLINTEPNTNVKLSKENNSNTIWAVAERDIKEGEELYCDYKLI
jgi:hypothetical protein